MSTQQSSNGMSLAFTEVQAPVRLIELPPELISIIEGSHTSHPPRFKIKAPLASSSSNANDHQAVLCTSTDTYQIRHVHSSNSIFLMQPQQELTSSSQGDDQDVDMMSDAMALYKHGMNITSTCASYLELLPYKANVLNLLKKWLPEFSLSTEKIPDNTETRSRGQLVNQIPISDAEFETAWSDLDAFELDGHAYRLSAQASIDIFTVFVTVIRAEGLGIWKGQDVQKQKLLAILHQDGEIQVWPAQAVEVVLQQTCNKDINMDSSIDPLPNQISNITNSAVYNFDKMKTSIWIGKRLLKNTKNSKMTKESFSARWAEILPDECSSFVDLNQLKYFQELPNGQITFSDDNSTGEGAAAKAIAGKNSKWHDRFKKR